MSPTKTCADCTHFQEKTRQEKPLGLGLCARKSTYPALDEPGQVVPMGAARVAPGAPTHKAVVQFPTDPACLDFVEKTP